MTTSEKRRRQNCEKTRRYKRRHRERVLEGDRQYRQRPEVQERDKRNRDKTPDKYIARWKLRNKVASGAIVKPERCEGCGVGSVPIEAHHRDYSKPFEVEWLCRPCHGALGRIVWDDRAAPDREPFDAEYYGMATRCHSAQDGDCDWEDCPQLRDGEPERSGRHCPLDEQGEEQ